MEHSGTLVVYYIFVKETVVHDHTIYILFPHHKKTGGFFKYKRIQFAVTRGNTRTGCDSKRKSKITIRSMVFLV